MTRKVIEGTWNASNLSYLNENFKELYDKITSQSSDVADILWDKLQDLNMLRADSPVTNRSNLPTTAPNMTMRVVESEHAIYIYNKGRWIKLANVTTDPYSKAIQDIYAYTSAKKAEIDTASSTLTRLKTESETSVSRLKSDAESALRSLKSSAINEIGTKKSEAVNEVTTLKTSTISEVNTSKNTAISTVTSLKDSAVTTVNDTKKRTIKEVTDLKTEVIAKLRDLDATDTSGWQKARLTTNDGDAIVIKSVDFTSNWKDTVKTGFYYVESITGLPSTIPNKSSFVKVVSSGNLYREIIIRPIDMIEEWVSVKYYSTWKDWKKVGANVEYKELYKGSASSYYAQMNLNDDYTKYDELHFHVTLSGVSSIQEKSTDITLNTPIKFYTTTFTSGDNPSPVFAELIIKSRSRTQFHVDSKWAYYYSGNRSTNDVSVSVDKIVGVKYR